MWTQITKKILLQIGTVLINIGLDFAFKAADKDGNGVLSKEEIWNFVIDKLRLNYKK